MTSSKNKAVINSIPAQFVNIINKLLLCGIFPNELKLAKVYSVFKSDNKITISNYRSTYVLPVFF